MNTSFPNGIDDADLDRKIGALGAELDSMTPRPPDFDDLRPGDRSHPSRLVPAAAALVLIVVGVAGIIALGGNDQPADETPAQQPQTIPTPETTTAEVMFDETGDRTILRTELDSHVTPLFALAGWDTTYAYSEEDLPIFVGGFEGALAVVGDGPMYDAPLFAAVVMPRSAEAGNAELELAAIGDPIEVAGTTGYVNSTPSDPDTGLDGPIVTLFWDLDDGSYIRVNTVRVGIDETVRLANQLDNDPVAGLSFESLPDRYRQLPMPEHDDHRSVEFQFELNGQMVQVNAENRGVASLLGRIAGEVRTTRVSDGLEIAYRPLPEDPGRYWVDWQLGDWSFYVSGDGFDSEEQFFGALSQIRAVDAAEFDAGEGGDLVTPSNRAEVVAAMLDGILLPPGVNADDLRSVGGVNVRYQETARISGAVACGWLDVWFTATDNDDPGSAQLAAEALATSATWPMLLDIENQGGWAQAVWEFADSINGGPGVGTGNGPTAPTRGLAESGLGCNFN